MLLSEVLALGSALCIALSSMFISELHGRLPLLTLARWQVTAAFLITAFVATALGGWSTVGLWQAGLLVLSGLSGIALASSTYFATIYAVGPRVTALLFSLTSPFALGMAYLALGETIHLSQGVGIVLILAGILIAIGVWPLPSPSPAHTERKVSSRGILLGVITALGQAAGSLLARPAMASGVEPFAAMAVRLGLAVVFFWALLMIPPIRRQSVPIRRPDLAIVTTSAFFGTAVGMSLLLAALKTGSVGIVSTLSSMTPIVILPLVWVRTRRRPPLAAWAGAALAIAGIALVSLK